MTELDHYGGMVSWLLLSIPIFINYLTATSSQIRFRFFLALLATHSQTTEIKPPPSFEDFLFVLFDPISDLLWQPCAWPFNFLFRAPVTISIPQHWPADLAGPELYFAHNPAASGWESALRRRNKAHTCKQSQLGRRKGGLAFLHQLWNRKGRAHEGKAAVRTCPDFSWFRSTILALLHQLYLKDTKRCVSCKG